MAIPPVFPSSPKFIPYDPNALLVLLQPIVKAIASVDPDIVGLQEVRGEGQARRLAKALKMNFAFEWHFTRRPWWGVAILSKFKIVKAWGIEISPGPRNIKSIILATLDVGGRLVTAVSVHKDKDLEDGDSFKIIMKEVNRIKEPVILMGDFNVDPDDWRLGLLKPRFIDTVKAVNTKNAAYVHGVHCLHRIVKAWGIEINPGPRNIKSIILATLDVGGRLVTAVSVHKDKDLEDGDSFKIIMKEVNRIKEPVILMGDFNVDPDDWRLGLLKPRFIDTVKAVNTKNAAYVQHEGTFFASQRRIDYVFINPHRFKVLDVGLIPYEHWEASDHLGYTTRVSLIP